MIKPLAGQNDIQIYNIHNQINQDIVFVKYLFQNNKHSLGR